MNDLLIVPAPASFGSYEEVPLAATLAGAVKPPTGRVFRKHILTLGPLHYKGRTFNLDENWYARLADNFRSGVSMCQVPLADGKNQHTEDPLRNTGEIIGLQREGAKVYDLIDVRDSAAAQRIKDGLIMGASAFLHMDYTDSRTGKTVGPALLHHCLTNRPHVVDLEPYEEVVAATADMEWEELEPVVLSQEEQTMTKEEMLAALKAEHGIDVEALQARPDTSAALTQIAEALKGSGTVQLSGEELTIGDTVGAIVELSGMVRTQGDVIAGLQRRDAEHEVDGFIGTGRLLPKSRERAVEMLLAGDRDGLEDFLAPEKQPYVQLSTQKGVDPSGEDAHQESDVDSELARLSAEHAEMFERGKDRSGSVSKH